MTSRHTVIARRALVLVFFVGNIAVSSTVFAQELPWTEMNSRIVSFYQQGRLGEAIPLAEQALDPARSLYGAESVYVATALNNLAALYHSAGRFADAEPLYRRALALDLQLFGEDHPRVGVDRKNLAQLKEDARKVLPATGAETKTGKDWSGWDSNYWENAGLVPPEEAPPPGEEKWIPEEEGEEDYDSGWKTDLSATSGWRLDDFDWNIAGNVDGSNPTVLSELTWEDLESYTVNGRGWIYKPSVIALRGTISYGWIYDGSNQDSDYLSDGRQDEFSRSNNSSDDGYVADAAVGIGYPWQPIRGDHDLRITPLAGWSYHRQHMMMTEGYQTIPATGPFNGLNSRYVANWEGPWTGLDIQFKPYERIHTYAGFDYHWAKYRADARWNLRSDFSQPKSYRHTADGEGFVVSAGLAYQLTKNWMIQGEGGYQKWRTDPGQDRTFFSSGVVTDTRLNEVNWESVSLSLGARCRF